MRIVLHIGTDKTGSTAIQHHLAANREWLGGQSIYIPRSGFGDGNGHAALFAEPTPARLQAMTDELLQAQKQGYRLALLSWEGLASRRYSQIRELRSCFAGFSVTLLIYLREQADVIQSGFLQEMKKLGSLPPLRVFGQKWPTLEYPRYLSARFPRYRNYYRLLRRWQRGLAGADVCVRIYDRRQWEAGDLIDDFLCQLGVQRNAGFQTINATLNVSLDAESAFYIDALRARGESQKTLLRLIDVALSVIAHDGPASRYFLSESVVASIRRHFTPSNRRLVRRYLGREGDLFDYDRPCTQPQRGAHWIESLRSRQSAINAVDTIPSFYGPSAVASAIVDEVSLAEGWNPPEAWGCWSEGSVSTIRFRIYHQHLQPFYSAVRLFVRGRYYGGNSTTRVRVNGLDFGLQSLLPEQAGLPLPIAQLGKYEMLEIELLHTRPQRPAELEGGDDFRQLAFGIESIGYDFVQDSY
jgi:hypothetical protein